jgi:hypothetical protein
MHLRRFHTQSHRAVFCYYTYSTGVDKKLHKSFWTKLCWEKNKLIIDYKKKYGNDAIN